MSMFSTDPYLNPYAVPRSPLFARRGMVATSDPLASQAGVEVLRAGGNAIDAAVAAAAALTVVEPTSNGIGGDAFALIWSKGKLYGLNASGPASRGISIDRLAEAGYREMPHHGWPPVTVPGIPAAWVEASRRFGELPLTRSLQSAINYAREGFSVAATTAALWRESFERYRRLPRDGQFEPWFQTFAPGGRPPVAGSVWSSPGHAETLQSIAMTEAASFYRGELAERIAAYSRDSGGYLAASDLAEYAPQWVDPISVNYRGYDVWELPPNGQGLIALMALGMLEPYSFSGRDHIDTYHLPIEAMKIGMTDGMRYITDPGSLSVPVASFLTEKYLAQRRSLITGEASLPEPGTSQRGGTVYLATADGAGNMVSWIQSNFEGFGSGLVVPGTGIALQNRGCAFSLQPDHPNCLAPGKRTYHTIIPGFLTRGNEAVGPFGVMGGFNQPQAHLQVVMNMVDFNLNPQASLDAPRWRWLQDRTVMVEPHFPTHLADALTRRGHAIQISMNRAEFGRGQIVHRDPESGVLMGGTESRSDGHIAVW
jgi:gamma-glutamyltranspeptidase / glutathione hydrolase